MKEITNLKDTFNEELKKSNMTVKKFCDEKNLSHIITILLHI